MPKPGRYTPKPQRGKVAPEHEALTKEQAPTKRSHIRLRDWPPDCEAHHGLPLAAAHGLSRKGLARGRIG